MTGKRRTVLTVATLVTLSFAGGRVTRSTSVLLAADAARSCESLNSLSISNATVTSAVGVAAGTFAPPGAAGRGTPAQQRQNSALPPFFRVRVTAKPRTDSATQSEGGLPAPEWNGKIQARGNGGWARRHS